jgi:hypothetical protein
MAGIAMQGQFKDTLQTFENTAAGWPFKLLALFA